MPTPETSGIQTPSAQYLSLSVENGFGTCSYRIACFGGQCWNYSLVRLIQFIFYCSRF